MVRIDETNRCLAQGYRELSIHNKLSPSILHTLKQAKKEYKGNTLQLYNDRGVIRKILYFFGIGLSREERSQLKCIRKINTFTKKAKFGTSGFFETGFSQFCKSIGKDVLKSNMDYQQQTEKFNKLLAFSLRDKNSLSAADIAEIRKYEGSAFYAPDAFFKRAIKGFLKSENVTRSEKMAVWDLLRAFKFSKKVNWKSVKHQTIQKSQPSPWYAASTAATLHKAIHKMKPGDEIAFTGTCTTDQGAHAVLFSCKMLDERGTMCLRLYNTGYKSDLSIGLGGLWNVGKAWWQGEEFQTAFLKNVEIRVEQALVNKDAILSDEFAEVFTDEILLFTEEQVGAGDNIFPRYRKFAASHKLDEYSIPNAPPPPKIHAQLVGNCAIASKLAYIEDKLGSELFSKFKGYILNPSVETA